MKITMAYGSGGKQTGKLINDIFIKHFGNRILNKMEDAAVLKVSGKIAFTTDSFVVTPLFFPGGDIGKVAVCGTINDLAMMGAKPKYLTAGFILEEGLELETLERIAVSMEASAKEARVRIVAGDTKVIEGKGSMYINTSGIGEIIKSGISVAACKEEDIILLSGNLGDHQAAIMSQRMDIKNSIQSDCAPLNSMVKNLLEAGVQVHFMRDVTRGGLATILNEAAQSSGLCAEIEEKSIPIGKEVKGLCDILGLDPLYMGNEGKMIAVVPKKQGEKALKVMRESKYGKNSAIIGRMINGSGVNLITNLGGRRRVDVLYGEGLPRIC